ncbi:hypothetical protein PV325_009757 [Microctonus aethiopoides]|nr:hypothetical protein PV325_009757 [Microctonus aethiopoides]
MLVSIKLPDICQAISMGMLGGVGGRHVSTRRRGSSPLVRGGVGLNPHGGLLGDGSLTLPDGAPRYTRRRRAVTTSDHKSCALIQTRLKLGDIISIVAKVDEYTVELEVYRLDFDYLAISFYF